MVKLVVADDEERVCRLILALESGKNWELRWLVRLPTGFSPGNDPKGKNRTF